MKNDFERKVKEFVPCVGDVSETLSRFFMEKYTIVPMKGNGVFGYTESEDYYFVWFVYTDKLLSNAKKVYNTVKELSKHKAVLYTGIKDFYCNNSIEITDRLYKIKIGE